MDVVFSDHAEGKFQLLEERDFPVSREQVLDCIHRPDKIEEGYKGRKIAQKAVDGSHVLRVVYSETAGGKRIITFYPGRRDRYEDPV